MILEKGEVFVSTLDLNVEGAKIEDPIKPTIRLAMPIFNKDGVNKGIIIARAHVYF